MEPRTTESVQATEDGVAAAIAVVWMLLGLASALAGCPKAAP